MPKSLDRRTVLRGLSGLAISLPVLEAMLDSNGVALAADASPLPYRYWVTNCGTSLGADEHEERQRVPNQVVPDQTGMGYDLKTGLAPFAMFENAQTGKSVQSEISVVSGLKVPWAGENGGVIPPGGRSDQFHYCSVIPQLTGTRVHQDSPYASTESSDQIAAHTLVDPSFQYFKSLHYCVQARPYFRGKTDDFLLARLSYVRGSDGNISSVAPTVSPRQAYLSLFSNFTASDPALAKKAALALEVRGSVLGMVRKENERLLTSLGAADRHRLNQHLEQLRDLERRVTAMPPSQVGECRALDDPGDDPAINDPTNDTDHVYWEYDDAAAGGLYSGEEQRATVLCDLIHMAIACDLARAGTLMFSYQKCEGMSLYPVIKDTGVAPLTLHSYSHNGGGTYGLAQAIAWHARHFGRLVAKLRDTPEGDGHLIDRCVLSMVFEGGHGLASEFPGSTELSSHSTENMIALIAGRAGGLKPGQHVRTNQAHPAQVLISGLTAVGVPGERLGDMTGVIPELFR